MISLELRKNSRNGTLKMVSESAHLGADDYVKRIQAIVSYLKAADRELLTEDDTYYMLDLLEDHLPTVEQAEKML